jgi:hypothetical protein
MTLRISSPTLAVNLFLFSICSRNLWKAFDFQRFKVDVACLGASIASRIACLRLLLLFRAGNELPKKRIFMQRNGRALIADFFRPCLSQELASRFAVEKSPFSLFSFTCNPLNKLVITKSRNREQRAWLALVHDLLHTRRC